MPHVAVVPASKAGPVLVSHTGVPLTREVASRFALDPTVVQQDTFFSYAGAARFAFNHHLARVRANLDQRRAEVSYGIAAAELTPSLSWSKVSLINEFNQFKNGELPSSPTNPDGSRGLAWRREVSGDVFECASVNAAQSLANFSNSLSDVRQGKKAGMPRFKSRHKTTPSFKLRSKSKPGQAAPVRVTGAKSVRLPTIGELRVHGCTKKVRRMLAAGRLHLYGATVTFEHGRWWVSLQGVAAVFHHERRSAKGRHDRPAGLDLGVTSLAVVVDDQGVVLRTVAGVKALQHARALRVVREEPVLLDHRGPECGRHGPTALFAPGSVRRRDGRPRPDDRLQGRLVRAGSRRGEPVVPQLENLLGLRQRQS